MEFYQLLISIGALSQIDIINTESCVVSTNRDVLRRHLVTRKSPFRKDVDKAMTQLKKAEKIVSPKRCHWVPA